MSLPQQISMSAIVPAEAGGPEVLRLYTRPVPQPGPGQVLIRVDWAGINQHDCIQRRRGIHPAGETDILGLEVAGTIVEIGEGVDDARHGTAVCALVSGGGYAEFAIAEADLALPVPKAMDMRTAACLPEALFTVWLNLMELGFLAPGETLLVHGGTGNIGSVAVQYGKLIGVRVIATVGNAAKMELSHRLGVDEVINYSEKNWVERVQALTAGKGVDVVLDSASRYPVENLDVLAPDGRILFLSSGTAGSFCPPLQMIMQKRAILTGAQLRPLPLLRKRRIAESLYSEVWPHLGTRITPLIDRSFDLADAAMAHEYVGNRTGFGKTVLRCRADTI